jgi:hypothetical protein
MWKEKFELRIDAHPEDGMMNVLVSRDGDYWIIDGLDSEPVRLPNDDNVLGQVMEVCQQIIDHVDNPLNFHLRSKIESAAEKSLHLGSVSICVQCNNCIQFDGKVWFHVNETLRHAAIPTRDEQEFFNDKRSSRRLRFVPGTLQKMIKSGQDYLTQADSLKKIERKSKAGRPPKEKTKD